MKSLYPDLKIENHFVLFIFFMLLLPPPISDKKLIFKFTKLIALVVINIMEKRKKMRKKENGFLVLLQYPKNGEDKSSHGILINYMQHLPRKFPSHFIK